MVFLPSDLQAKAIPTDASLLLSEQNSSWHHELILSEWTMKRRIWESPGVWYWHRKFSHCPVLLCHKVISFSPGNKRFFLFKRLNVAGSNRWKYLHWELLGSESLLKYRDLSETHQVIQPKETPLSLPTSAIGSSRWPKLNTIKLATKGAGYWGPPREHWLKVSFRTWCQNQVNDSFLVKRVKQDTKLLPNT